MITVRRSEERRHIGNKDQETWLTFDWENKADPLKNGFGVLEILNEEILSPGSGFSIHTRKDVVIVTYLQGGVVIYKSPLEEPDFMESKDFQRENVNPDIKHYLFNVSQTEKAHVFQGGFTPLEGAENRKGIKKLFTNAERHGILRLVASPDGRDASLAIQQDVHMYSTYIHTGNHVIHELKTGRTAWLHVVKGQVLLNNLDFQTGDGIGFTYEKSISFTAKIPTEILLFDLGVRVPAGIKMEPEKKVENIQIR